MKNLVIPILFITVLFSCSKSDQSINVELIGTWKLIEVLADPGDGSGTFQSVNSDKTITFNEDGTLTSNGSLCNLSTDTNSPSSGTYSIENSTFEIPSCNAQGLNYTFELTGSELIVNMPCIEPCRAKYTKQ